jgi:hypothetical protein
MCGLIYVQHEHIALLRGQTPTSHNSSVLAAGMYRLRHYVPKNYFLTTVTTVCIIQMFSVGPVPRGLRRGSAAASLLGLWVRNPPVAWMPVSCECCMLSDRSLCVGLITRPEESYRMWCVYKVWSRNLHKWGGLGPPRGCRAIGGKKWGQFSPWTRTYQFQDVTVIQFSASQYVYPNQKQILLV